jgi:hypothetical protein
VEDFSSMPGYAAPAMGVLARCSAAQDGVPLTVRRVGCGIFCQFCLQFTFVDVFKSLIFNQTLTRLSSC